MTMNWQELLEQLSDFGVKGMEQTGLPVFVLAMGFSLLSALFVAYLYSVFYKSRASGSQVHRAFPLLGISITAIFITIQFSLPLSLGLLGALSIVRFRTPIKEPEEIAFVMFVVATSLCCATFNLLFLAIILATAVLALLLMQYLRGMRRTSTGHGMVVVNLPAGADPEAAVLSFLLRELPVGGLDSVTDADGESIVSYRFAGLEAARIAGLKSGLREIDAGASCNFYFDRASAL
jgi:hypothetical protein